MSDCFSLWPIWPQLSWTLSLEPLSMFAVSLPVSLPVVSPTGSQTLKV